MWMNCLILNWTAAKCICQRPEYEHVIHSNMKCFSDNEQNISTSLSDDSVQVFPPGRSQYFVWLRTTFQRVNFRYSCWSNITVSFHLKWIRSSNGSVGGRSRMICRNRKSLSPTCSHFEKINIENRKIIIFPQRKKFNKVLNEVLWIFQLLFHEHQLNEYLQKIPKESCSFF